VTAQATILSGRRVLETEAAALGVMAAGLGGAFARAVDVLLATKGRIVVCGMGKSGHIARKIAATFASTGAPAQFVHPAEASHGDLGMITRNDVVLALSNSGETAELADIITHTGRFSIPLIGVARNPDSVLLRQADVALVLPDVDEACAVGLAPTTSTTMTLALGDALAIAMMEQRGFSPEDFRLFHPRGRIGAQLVRVGDLMHGPGQMPVVKDSDSMGDALLVMTRQGFGVAGVIGAAGWLDGIITDGDLRRNMEGLLECAITAVMTGKPVTVTADMLASEALGLMNDRAITSLFVVEAENNRTPVGFLHLHDCLRAGIL